jgi:hypothetical protein
MRWWFFFALVAVLMVPRLWFFVMFVACNKLFRWWLLAMVVVLFYKFCLGVVAAVCWQ